jgi:hypothetical protein
MNPLFPSTVAKIRTAFSQPPSSQTATNYFLKMLELDQPVRDRVWKSAEIELIIRKHFLYASLRIHTKRMEKDATHYHQTINLPRKTNNEKLPVPEIQITLSHRRLGNSPRRADYQEIS